MKRSKLLDKVRKVIRAKQFAYSTEKTYVNWIYRFIVFQNKKHPKDMGSSEIAEYLRYLASERKVSASTQNQALNALVFLYKHVLEKELLDFNFKHAHIGTRLPVVLSRNEISKLFAHLDGEYVLMTSLLYGSGLRLMECLRLRVKDIDFEMNEIVVRLGKGDNDRRTILPNSLIMNLKHQIELVKDKYNANMQVSGFKCFGVFI